MAFPSDALPQGPWAYSRSITWIFYRPDFLLYTAQKSKIISIGFAHNYLNKQLLKMYLFLKIFIIAVKHML